MTSGQETDWAYSGFGASQICHLSTYLDINSLTYSPGSIPGPTRGSNFTKFSVHVTCGMARSSSWLQRNKLCTSSFMNDVMFSHNRAYVVRLTAKGCQSAGGDAEGMKLKCWSSTPPRPALPPADRHLRAVSIAVHNRIWLWRRIMRCTSGTKSAILDCHDTTCNTTHSQLLFYKTAQCF